MHEQQISPDGHGRYTGKPDHAGGKLVYPAGDGGFGGRLLLQARELQQIIVSRALLVVAKDFAGIDDLPEFKRGIRIARPEVGVGALDGIAERGPKTLSVIVRKSPEQIVKRRHRRSRRWISRLRPKFRREFTREHAYKLNVTSCG